MATYHDIRDPQKRPFHYSMCKTLLEQSPAHMLEIIQNGKPPTRNQKFGTLFHCLLLEPEKFSERFIREPTEIKKGIEKTVNRGRNDYDAWRNEQKEKGLEIYSIEEMEKQKGMLNSVKQKGEVAALFSNGKAEVEVKGFNKYYQMPLSITIDWHMDNGIMIDLKKTKDASPVGFGKAIHNFHYDIQAALYCDVIVDSGLEYMEIMDDTTGELIPLFVWVCIEDFGSFEPALYYADSMILDRGREKYKQAMRQWRECLDSNSFPGYSREFRKPELPNWYLREVYKEQY